MGDWWIDETRWPGPASQPDVEILKPGQILFKLNADGSPGQALGVVVSADVSLQGGVRDPLKVRVSYKCKVDNFSDRTMDFAEYYDPTQIDLEGLGLQCSLLHSQRQLSMLQSFVQRGIVQSTSNELRDWVQRQLPLERQSTVPSNSTPRLATCRMGSIRLARP